MGITHANKNNGVYCNQHITTNFIIDLGRPGRDDQIAKL